MKANNSLQAKTETKICSSSIQIKNQVHFRHQRNGQNVMLKSHAIS